MQNTTLRDDAALKRLIAALEKATGPDVGGCLLAAIRFAQAAKWIDREAAAYARNLVAHGASLDAALTLVPDGWSFHIAREQRGRGWASLCGPDGDGPAARSAPTPALALCIAALRARAAT